MEIARREEPVPTLRKALEQVKQDTGGRPGERRDRAMLLARIAEALTEAPLLSDALAVMGPTDSVEHLEMSVTIVCEALVRIARAHFALGERKQGLALLDRAAHLAENDVESLARVAAELERAAETAKAEKVLGRALANLDAIASAEWRGYAWHAVVEAYADAGQIDRALEILVAGKPANPDKYFAFTIVPDDALLMLGREQRWRLLAALPRGWTKVDLEARLASRLDREGDTAEAERLVADALASIDPKDWAWDLIRLATVATGVDRPGDAAQQRILRQFLQRKRARR